MSTNIKDLYKQIYYLSIVVSLGCDLRIKSRGSRLILVMVSHLLSEDRLKMDVPRLRLRLFSFLGQISSIFLIDRLLFSQQMRISLRNLCHFSYFLVNFLSVFCCPRGCSSYYPNQESLSISI